MSSTVVRSIGVGVVLLGALLYASNPTTAELREHMTAQAMARIDKETTASDSQAMGSVVKMALPMVMSQITIQQQNYLFFSVFRHGITASPDSSETIPECYMGVAKQFIALDRC